MFVIAKSSSYFKNFIEAKMKIGGALPLLEIWINHTFELFSEGGSSHI